MQKIFNLSNLTLIVALTLSTVAAYYSIIGLTAIFAGAVIPVIIMGSILEVGKITTTVWLRKYWHQCGIMLKLYLVPAVVALAVLTSMGIFGFLSKAHTDSGLVSGDVQAKLSLIDEKIKTQRDNIEIARKALTQMDAQVDARLNRGDSEQSAERAVQIRRQQAGERSKLQKEIGDAQKIIAQLNEERAPIAAENRKVEAEVGPIKYVAALIYGDDPDTNLLERAVRWVIILLVIVFDPLAIALVLAANASKEWDKKIASDIITTPLVPVTEDEIKPQPIDSDKETPIEAPWPKEWKEWSDSDVDKLAEETLKDIEKEEEQDILDKHPYLKKGFKYPDGWKFEPPLVYKPEPINNLEEKTEPTEPVVEIKSEPTVDTEVVKTTETLIEIASPSEEIKTDNVTKENPMKSMPDSDYVLLEGKQMRREAAEALRPELLKISADPANSSISNFGTTFPRYANKGDTFVRVDVLPNRVFKFDGKRWIEINKELTQTYLHNDEYIRFLVSKIDTGEYDIEMLNEKEKEQIESFLKASK
jgi:hypothetical protein